MSISSKLHIGNIASSQKDAGEEVMETKADQIAKQESDDLARHARAHALGIMAKHLYEEAVKQRLIGQEDNIQNPFLSSSPEIGHYYEQSISSSSSSKIVSITNLTSVALRIDKGDYTCWPLLDDSTFPWVTSLSILNVGAALTVRSTATKGIIDLLAHDTQEVVLGPSSRIQVLEDVSCLARARKAQGVAFVRSMGCMVVWSDKAIKLLQEAQQHHNRVLRFLWKVVEPECENEVIQEVLKEVSHEHQSSSIPDSASNYFQFTAPYSVFNSAHNLGSSISLGQSSIDSPISGSNTPFSNIYQRDSSSTHSHLVLGNGKKSYAGSSVKEQWGNEKMRGQEEGNAGIEGPERPVMMLSSIHHGSAAALAVCISAELLGSALSKTLLDGDYTRMAGIALLPITFIMVMFFCDSLVGSILMIFGPVQQLRQNSSYHSGKKPAPFLPNEIEQLPHITIQMPVFKESLEGVLKPSFESVKKAIQTYELQGGSASIIVSEDGLVLVDEEERRARLAYYEENNITWIARPKHGDQGFIRPGRFKKASNLNFTYEVMRRVELRMKSEFPNLLHPLNGKPLNTNREEKAIWQQAYNLTMQTILSEIHPTAAGSGIDQMGEFILMIDSDTRIPLDCFMDAAIEMTRCKDVGILQHCSGVMQVTSSFFESCIAYFTRMVNMSITFAAANGDVAPFMGHNAYLRWSAMQEAAREEVNEKGLVSYKIWSDEHVSEDFVMALDMLDKGYIVRWATYSNNEYLEGVTLTCEDELNRWPKYAWGVSEMIFNPIKRWYKGPLTPLIRRFWFGNSPLHYKWAATSYCFSYYAIALSLPLSIVFTLVESWFNDYAHGLFNTNFRTLVSVIMVYLTIGSASMIMLRYRAGRGNWFVIAWELIKHIPFMLFFFGGLSYHILTALLSHICGVNMSWGATLKDVEQNTVWAELPALFKRFWRLFLICILIIVTITVLQFPFIPLQFQLASFFVIGPLYFVCIMHILYPFILNPNLLHFSF